MIRTILALFGLLLLGSHAGLAQKPFIQNYDPKRYKADGAVFDMVQADNGMMYFANGDGVLQYDGQRWELIHVPGKTVRSLAIDSTGRIYVGSNKDFGYLKPDARGRLRFESLGSLLPEEEKPLLGTTWNIFATAKGMLFCGQQRLYRYQPDQPQPLKIWKTSSDFILHYFVKGQYYVSEDHLLRLHDDDSLRPVPHSEEVIEALPSNMAPGPGGSLFIAGSDGRFFRHHPDSGTFTLLQPQSADWFAANGIYEMAPVPEAVYGPWHYAIASSKGGVAIVDAQGEMVQVFNESTGLQHNSVYKVFFDRSHSLWVGTPNGLSKVSVDLAYSVFDRDFNVRSRVHAVIRHGGLLYIGSNLGMLYLYEDPMGGQRFEPVEGVTAQTWRFEPYGKGLMVAGGNHGAFYVEGKKALANLPSTSAVMSIGVSRRDSSIIYVPMYNGFQVCRFQQGRFIELGRVPGIHTDCRAVVEDDDGRVWLATTYQGVYRIDFGEGRLDAKAVAEARVSHYGPEQGLGELMRNRIWPAPGGGLLFTSEQRVYRFDAAQDRFLPWEALPVDFSAPGYQNPTFYQSPQGSWLGTEDRVMELAKSGLGYLADSTALMGMGVGSSAFFQDPDGTLYMANGDGLFVYKPQRRAKQALPSVLIREVHLSKSGQLLLDPSQIGTSPLPIEYANNALQFSFALPDYHSEEESRFQYWLEGYEQRWSDWAELASKEYTNLREGRYVFKVRAKSALGAMTEVSTFAFEILPPWYRTVYAWVVYALGGLLLGYVALQAYTRRLQQAKARLERLVEQRTEEVRRQGQEILAKKVELEQQKEEIEAQAESLQVANRQIGAQHDALAQQKASLEVQHQELNAAFSIINKKNKDITASIQYAQRIQRAVLPARERLLAMLPAHLLLYWPKDIVSGDFYWVERLPDSGNLLVVAADCTGHGVPGAFMSLVGDSLLKQLVFHERVFEPAALLERMHEGVRQALSQTATGGQEGMDMAVCLLDMEAQEVRFAGAKRPLLYFEKGELEEIKGTRRSVGGSHFLEGTAFEQHRIPAGPDTVFYLHSDGIPDQVGGAQGRKLMSKRFKLALQRMARLPLEQQEARMAQMLQEWKEGEKQVDDILLLGFRMPYP